MFCTFCSNKTSVTNSRHQKKANNVWRRRSCISCRSVFSTIETVDYEKTWVVKYKDGTTRPFLRDKLMISIYKSIQHRPSALLDARALCGTAIARSLPTIHNGTLDVSDLARTVHEMLGRFDAPAAIHYKAFHRDALKR